MPNHTDRRTVLKTTGGLLAGVTTVAGQVAGDEIKPLNMDVKQEAINPDEEGRISTRVTVPQRIADHADFPGLVYFGHFDKFTSDGETLFLPERTEGVLATPVRTVEVGGRSGDTFTNDMLYDTGDVDFSGASGETVELGLGFFPSGAPSDKPDWDTDTVRFEPAGIGEAG